MEIQKSCPECRATLPANAKRCRCGWTMEVVVVTGDGRTGQTCAFDDHGRSCPCRGIISTSTNGEGKFFCREHWARVNKLEPDGVGNALPEHAKRADESMIDYLKRVPRESRHRSADVKQWDAWKYNPKTKRLERRVELDIEEIPEEVGQG